jgi:chromosome segregation ATPase
MSEEERREERNQALDAYLKTKATLDALLVRRRRVGEALRDLSQVFLQSKLPAADLDWELLAEPQALQQLIREIDEAFSRKASLRAELESFGVKLVE